MSKFTPLLVGSGYQTTANINANFVAIQVAFENTLSRDGTSPNSMTANLDMNSHRQINLPAPAASTDPARWIDVTAAILPTGMVIPNVLGQSGKYISTDGAVLTWSSTYPVLFSAAGLTIPALQNGYFLSNNGSALVWTSLTAFGLVSDPTPTLGADMDTAGFKIKFNTGTGLYDSSGNLVVKLVLTASAVNYVTFTNNSSTNAPLISADGKDTNIDVSYRAKGTGAHNFLGTATTSAKLKLFEQTSNGTSSITFQAPAALDADRNITLPDSDITCFVVNRASTETGAVATGTTQIPNDDSKPQKTEGDEYMTRTITPKNAGNILVIDVVCNISSSAITSNWQTTALFKNSDADCLACVDTTVYGGNLVNTPAVFKHIMVAGTTSTITFKVRSGNANTGTTTFNGWGGNRKYGGAYASSIHITEYSA